MAGEHRRAGRIRQLAVTARLAVDIAELQSFPSSTDRRGARLSRRSVAMTSEIEEDVRAHARTDFLRLPLQKARPSYVYIG